MQGVYASKGDRCKPLMKSEKSGGARRDRTDDLLLAKQALSQLSYGPIKDPEYAHERRFRQMAATGVAAGPCYLRMAGCGQPLFWHDGEVRPHRASCGAFIKKKAAGMLRRRLPTEEDRNLRRIRPPRPPSPQARRQMSPNHPSRSDRWPDAGRGRARQHHVRQGPIHAAAWHC